MKTPQTHAGRVRGGALLWIILIIGLVSLAVFYFAPSKSAPPPTLAARTPSPSTSTSITPLSPPPTPEPRPTPEPPAATPTPAPVVRATPTPAPTPVPLDLATVARTPALWPQQIALVREVSLPIMFNGQTAGQAQVKPGTLLRLWRVSAQHV